MAVLSDIRNQIKSDLVIVGDIYDSQIDTAIRAALRELRSQKFWFLEKISNLSLLATVTSLNLPSDFGCAGSFDLLTSSSRYTDRNGFKFLNFNELRERCWRDNPVQSGQPIACAVSGTRLYVSHTTDIAYTVAALYYQKDATLPTASQTSVWFDDGYDVVRTKAQFIFKRDAQAYSASDEDGSMMERAMAVLERQHERLQGSR